MAEFDILKGRLGGREDTPCARIRIAHCGDPQFGFSSPRGSEEAYQVDLTRFERVIESVNRARPDLCYITGDLTHSPKDLERDWPRLLERFDVPLLVTPGNHDTGVPVSGANVERFVRVIGYDYKSVKIGSWWIIGGNSQYWHPTEETQRAARYEAWLADELEKARESGALVVICSHIPPFVESPDEPDGYENCPKATRSARVERALRSGAKFWLSGHTHRMIAHNLDGLPVLCAETSCDNFDGRPHGYRMLEVDGQGNYTWTFVPRE